MQYISPLGLTFNWDTETSCTVINCLFIQMSNILFVLQILDLVSTLSHLYFQEKLPVTLSYAQASILLCIGLQNQDISYIEVCFFTFSSCGCDHACKLKYVPFKYDDLYPPPPKEQQKRWLMVKGLLL